MRVKDFLIGKSVFFICIGVGRNYINCGGGNGLL